MIRAFFIFCTLIFCSCQSKPERKKLTKEEREELRLKTFTQISEGYERYSAALAKRELAAESMGIFRPGADVGSGGNTLTLHRQPHNPKLLQKAYKAEFTALHKLAKKGNVEAQYQVGVMCKYGFGCEKDMQRAWHWLSKAHKKGHVKAGQTLLFMTEHGDFDSF